MMRIAPIAAAVLLLAACAPPATTSPGGASSASPSLPDAAPPSMVDERAACNAHAAQSLVGQPASQANAERARELAGAKSVRLLAHDAIITMEYMVGRLNVVFDAGNRIQAIRCG